MEHKFVIPTTQRAYTLADEAAKRELQKTKWVRDLYVSPGHMNIGVLHGEKDWNSPMIGKWVCAVLVKNGSSLERYGLLI